MFANMPDARTYAWEPVCCTHEQKPNLLYGNNAMYTMYVAGYNDYHCRKQSAPISSIALRSQISNLQTIPNTYAFIRSWQIWNRKARKKISTTFSIHIWTEMFKQISNSGRHQALNSNWIPILTPNRNDIPRTWQWPKISNWNSNNKKKKKVWIWSEAIAYLCCHAGFFIWIRSKVNIFENWPKIDNQLKCHWRSAQSTHFSRRITKTWLRIPLRLNSSANPLN